MLREFHHHMHHDDDTERGPLADETVGQRSSGRGRHHQHGGGRGRGGPGAFGPDGPGPFGRGGPGPFGPRGRQRRPKGAIREAVLSLLADGPANGYGLMKGITQRSDGDWSPSPGSVYPTLAQLVDEGLIAPTSAEKGTDYALTDAGVTYVEQNPQALAAVWADSAEGSASRLAMRESVAALMGVLDQYRLASTEDQRERAVERLDKTRRALHRILGE
jgi:DNA-binding PadR family transcriptional regulator